MDIRAARKIAGDVGNVRFSNDDRREAFYRLHCSVNKGLKQDYALAKAIWDFFGNLDKEKAQK